MRCDYNLREREVGAVSCRESVIYIYKRKSTAAYISENAL